MVTPRHGFGAVTIGNRIYAPHGSRVQRNDNRGEINEVLIF